MREQAWTFGPGGGLVGIVAEPQGGAPLDRPAAVLFNVGLNHHVGPNRFNVELARALAEQGFASLRFDVSGLGDSAARADASGDEERARADLVAALDEFQRRKGVGTFTLIAICSGVDAAHHVATSDPRVRGAVFVDGYAYTTPGYWARQLAVRASRFIAPSAYLRAARRRFGPLATPRSFVGDQVAIFDRTFPPVAEFRSDLATMLGHAQVLFLYTRHAYFFNHRGQFARMIGLREPPAGVTVEHLRDSDHVFTPVGPRRQAIDLIVRWIMQLAPGTPAALAAGQFAG